MDSFRHRGLRRQLIEQLRQQGLYNEQVLEVMANVPRHVFLDSSFQEWAYRDEPFPIDCEQTISQPSTVAWQTTALELLPRQHVLEIGTGSGYQAAVLSLLGGRVFTVERHKLLYQKAKLTLKKLRLDRIRCYLRDGTKGLPEMAPYDRILATAGAAAVPPALREQLKVGGIMIIPVGPEGEEQTLLKIVRTGDNAWTEENLGGCRFVPFKEGLG
ncbi:protein-L-isoaspartate(D-aspartate) O-methyltransferase [Neolewinella lacunae]|uniref:Protein-L-isoaspartate O-methyltransferase n=1 Tax=Neolewinella lacunae TaxID=1517758 RepID=A0A923PNW8_9BACT|nr:protein-L-isoaspartate(D-aspartate) O-methyltransferase [Neolewinella lacunae]MBC6994713.1 protein-L-isoaspartate(D-aspartate) O-methyltransferase [Neolewinella lacunae]MDN3634585.1 protein-L-isoaspartate(D-aspartate) O-methyltransferase [Neolewinella lacunae]